jgi:transcriptional regulator with XRE-family HTH domain
MNDRPPPFREPDDPQEMAARIRAARAWAGLTRDQLAERLDRSKSTIERWERGDIGALGRTRHKRARLWLDLSRATGVWVGFFVESWNERMTGEKKKEDRALYEEAAQDSGRRLEERLSRIEGALGISPMVPLPDPAEVEQDLDEVEAELGARRAGKPPASGSEREAG